MSMDQILVAYKEGKISSEDVLRYAEKERTAKNKYPLSEGQKGLWFLTKVSPLSSVYNVPISFPIDEEIQNDKFEKAFHQVLRKYPILGIKIHEEDGEPYQTYQAPESLKLSFEDVSQLSTEEFQTLVEERAKQPFDLSKGPLIRVSIFSKSPQTRVVLIVVHHIVFDAASMPILMKEIFSAYGNVSAESNGQADPGRHNYFNFVSWEKAYLDSQEGKRARTYWHEHLKGELPVLELPMERKSYLDAPVVGDTLAVTLSAAESAEISGLSTRYGVNLSVIFLCAYQILLSRYSGNPDVVVGMPSMGRTRSEFDLMIGYFVNMMPLRTVVDPNKDLETFLKEVQGILADSIDHASYPFPKLVSELNVERGSNVSAVFQVAFSYQAKNLLQLEIQPRENTENEAESLNEIQQEGEFKLVLEVRESFESIVLKFKYDASVLTRDSVSQVAEHYKTLLISLVKEPAQVIGKYNVISENEKSRILNEWTDTAKDLGPIHTLHGLFEVQAENNPKQTAVIYENKKLSYGDLNVRAKSLARVLLEQGLQKEDLVAILIEKGCDQVVALMAVMMAGGSCLPMETDWPTNRHKEIVSTANCKILLSTGDHIENSDWPEHFKIVDVKKVSGSSDVFQEDLSSYSFPTVNPEDVAYVIFTSGSTGKPKGVVIQHGAVVNTIKDINQRFEIGSEDKVLAISALSFDLSFYDIFGLLGAGGTVVFPNEDERINPNAWTALLDEYQITIWNTVPALLQMLVDHLDVRFPGDQKFRLRLAFLSGDWIPVTLPLRATKAIPGMSLISLGGATEASIWSNFYPIKNVNVHSRSIPYGKPLANQRFYILDDDFNLCPIGVIGNLFIAGEGLAKGYFGDEPLTEASFIQHEVLNQRLYKTGDLARWKIDGNAELIGRIDHQIKLRGFRIELGEIESKLLSHPQICSCIVVLSGETEDEKRLVAYLVSDNVAESEKDKLIGEVGEFLKSVLPDYMQPSAYMMLDKLPLTANGKINRGALPKIEIDDYLQVAYLPPENDLEQMLTRLWGELLGVDGNKISREANFFSLGGHSMLAMRLIAKLQENGISADLRTIFRSETLAALALELEDQYDEDDDEEDNFEMDEEEIPEGCERIEPYMLTLVPWIDNDDINEIVRQVPGGSKNIQDIYAMAPRQEGILIHHLMATDEDPYVLAALVSVESETMLEKYLQALQTLIDRHDVLRTAIMIRGLQAPVQVVLRKATLAVEDLSSQVKASNLTAHDFMQRRLSESRRVMDVSKAPLLRVELVQGGPSSTSYVLLRWHHIIADHEGLVIIGAEVDAILRGHGQNLPPPARNRKYIAAAIYQAEELDSSSYFTDLLGDITEPTFPFNLDNVRVEGREITVLRNKLLTGLSLKLRRIAQQYRTSPAILFHAAWALLIARCSGRDDVVFGTVLSGRFQGIERADAMLGMFINTLPLRISLKGKSVQDLLVDTDRALVGLMEYEQTSLSLAQSCSGLEFGVPLFSGLINYRHTFSPKQNDDIPQDDLGINVIGFQERTNYPFMLAVDDLGEDFSIELQVHNSISAERVIGYLEQTLTMIADAVESDPNQELAGLSVITESDKHKLLFDWNATESELDNNQCLHALIEENVRSMPDKTALIFNESSISYGVLDKRANQVANYLRGRGVTTESLVGICVNRSLEMVIGMLGILKAGAAFIPIDPKFPQSRIEFVLQDANVEILLTQTSVLHDLPFLQTINHICLDIDAEISKDLYSLSDKLDSSVTALPKNLAYVIYTSGSTGKPKGVMIEHKAVVNLLLSMANEPGLNRNDILLAVTTFSFDISILEIFLPLIMGAQIQLSDKETAEDPNKLAALIKSSRATIMQATPTTWNMLFYSGWRNDEKIKILCGGEALPEPLKMEFVRSNSNAWNVYGPTETTIWSAISRIKDGSPITIGKPIANTEFYVVNETMQLVPVDVPGELCIGGEGLARGYLNREQLTKEKFVSNPYKPGNLMYRTGDLVRWLDDGELEYLSRIDSQVKIRGFRIELGEIETQLLTHESVKNCVVIDWKDASGEKSLIAYVVLEKEAEQDSNSNENLRAGFKEYLAASLPAYLVPNAFVFIDKVPTTPNGKVCRNALPSPVQSLLDFDKFVAPRTELERELAEIWSEALPLETNEISVTAGFFDLGGHSVLSMFIVNLINKRLSTNLEIRVLMENPTIEQLAKIILSDQAEPELEQGLIRTTGDKEHAPLSFAQERLWFLSKLEGSSSHYNMPMALRFENQFNREALIRSLDLLMSRHAAFRTRIVEKEDKVYQILDDQSDFLLEEKELHDEAQLQQLYFKESSKEFDFSTQHLIRAQLLKHAKNKYTLLITMHHIISDATSMMIFVSELINTYLAECGGQPVLLKPLEVQYRDYAGWQREMLTDEVINTQLSFWKEALKDANTDTPLVTDRIRPPIKTYNGTKITFDYPPENLSKLKKLGSDRGATLYMTLLAAFAILLNRRSQQSDLTIGSPITNRNRSELENVIGLFVNTVVMRIRVEEHESFIDTLEQVKRVTKSAYANQDIPFETLVEALNPARNLSLSPLFQVMFNLTSTANMLTSPEEAGSSSSDLKILSGEHSVSLVNHQIDNVKFDLLFNLHESSQGLSAEVEFNTDLFDKENIERLIQQYINLLDIVGRAPNSTMYAQDLMTKDEREKILKAWTATEHAFAEEKATLHSLFTEKAKEVPDNIAVISDEGELSYAELCSQARRIAYELLSNNIQSGDLVGVVMDKGPHQVAAVLGVLFAGAAYLPLDTRWPSHRIEEILIAGKCRFALSTATNASEATWNTDGLQQINVDQLAPLSGEELESLPLPRVSTDDLAYVIFTSGSTGKPKGVMIEHGSAVNTILDINEKFTVTASDRVLAVSQLSFDLSVYDIFGMLAAGAGIVFPSSENTTNPELWMKSIVNQKVTIWNSVPGMFQMLVDYISINDSHIDTNKAQLRISMLSGDWIPISLPDNAKLKLPDVSVIALGGATEASIWSNYYSIETSMQNRRSVPYGKPLSNQRFYILDDELNLCPIGVKGNLYIAGAGIARGYWGDETQTNRQFIEHPRLKQRLYKTGDFGRWLNDGNIEFLGRNDTQVKVRGYRIELGEIEYQLLQHDDIEASIVIASRQKTGENHLVAYLVPKAEAGLIEKEALRARLLQHLGKLLPNYMIPETFVFLEALPLSENGKVDRKNLPEPNINEIKIHTFMAPCTDTEVAIANIWQDMLSVEKIGIRDSFFELGGNSILTVRLAKRLKMELGLDISLRDIFRNPTIEMLSAISKHSTPTRSENDFKRANELEPVSALAQGHYGPSTVSTINAITWREGGGSAPLFIAHSVVAYSLGFSQLVESLPEDVPVYGLQFSLSDYKRCRNITMEGLASLHVQTIRTIQPVGPYRLIGHSSGGLLAYEIAYQLMGDDQDVEFIGMIDTQLVDKSDLEAEVLSHDSVDLMTQGVSTLLQVANIDANLDEKAWADCYEPIIEEGEVEKAFAKSFANYRQAGLDPILKNEEIWDYEKLYRCLYESITSYIVPPLPIPVHLFQASQSLEERPSLGWNEELTRSWVKTTIDANHTNIITRPNITKVSETIIAVLCKENPQNKIRGESSPDLIQKIQHGSPERHAIFCIPGAGGNVSQFIPFTDLLSKDVPVYGIQHRGSSGGDGVPHATITAMASRYAAEISCRTHSHPVQLIGHSLGAWIAFEVACRLESLRIPVAPVVVMDPDPFSDPGFSLGSRENIDILEELIEIFRSTASKEFTLSGSQLVGLGFNEQIDLLHKHLITAGIVPLDSTKNSIRTIWHVFSAHSRIQYRPKRELAAAVIVLVSRDSWCRGVDSVSKLENIQKSWNAFAKSVTITKVPGNHITMLDSPNIQNLREQLSTEWNI